MNGDATCGNVSVDLPQETATWFDFDTRHRREISELDRFTDDYRALIFSAACVLDESLYPRLAELRWESMPTTQGKHFQALLATAGQFTTLFELAQAPLTRKQGARRGLPCFRFSGMAWSIYCPAVFDMGESRNMGGKKFASKQQD